MNQIRREKYIPTINTPGKTSIKIPIVDDILNRINEQEQEEMEEEDDDSCIC